MTVVRSNQAYELTNNHAFASSIHIFDVVIVLECAIARQCGQYVLVRCAPQTGCTATTVRLPLSSALRYNISRNTCRKLGLVSRGLISLYNTL